MIDIELGMAWRRALAPPPVVAPSSFAEAEIVLPGSANALPGPLRLAPYQRELVDAIASPNVEIVVMMLSAQTGKSISIDAMLGYCIGCAPGPMLHVSPTGSRSEDFVRDRFDPLIAASSKLRGLVGKGQDKRKGNSGGANSLASKSFPGGQLNFASSFKADELAARAIKFLFLDEIDRFAHSAGVEGDPIRLAIKRTKTYEGKGRKIVIVSTPTSRVGSRINQWFLRGDQRKFKVQCSDCGHRTALAFENLRWDEGQPETAYLTCEECGAVHDEQRRRAMLEAGAWEATAQGEPGIRSYHLTELASKFSSLASVARQAEDAKTPEEKQTFYNLSLAQVYDAASEVELSSSELQERAEPIKSPYASSIVFVTAGVDVQRDRLECTSLAHHGDGTYSVLNHVKLMGDTSGPVVWRDLDGLLGSTFPIADGRILRLAVTAVDTNWNADMGLAFVSEQRRKSRPTIAVFGRGGFDRMPLRRSAQARGQMTRMIVGVDRVKHAVQQQLAAAIGEPGYIRLPDHLPPEYFEGLASEQLRVRYVKGAPRHEFHRVVRRNEPFDCLVYAMAIAGTVNVKALSAPKEPQPSFRELAAKLHAAHNP